jgi:acyl carrier protein
MATSQREVADLIETFIRREFRILDEGPPFTRNVHLFESGCVDSAGVVELIMFVESTFGVKLEDDDVFSEQFTTIDGISAIVMACATRPDDLRAAIR